MRSFFQQALEKIKELEAELVAEKAAVSTAESLLRKKNEKIRMVERALRDQSAEVEAIKKQCADVEALKAKVATLEKVN